MSPTRALIYFALDEIGAEEAESFYIGPEDVSGAMDTDKRNVFSMMSHRCVEWIENLLRGVEKRVVMCHKCYKVGQDRQLPQSPKCFKDYRRNRKEIIASFEALSFWGKQGCQWNRTYVHVNY